MKKIIINSKFINKIIFYLGYLWFNIAGKTPNYSKMAMINLYCLTGGVFITNFNKRFKKSNFNFLNNESIFDYHSEGNRSKIITELKTEGYAKLNTLLDEKITKSLVDFSLKTTANVKGKAVFFDHKKIISNIYRFSNKELLNNVDVQKIIMDPQLINFARDYFNCDPVFDYSAMWYSTSYDENISDDAAQQFHFDYDRTKWLKVFFYLTDVDDLNGPHCYIRGSHLDNTKPKYLLDRGYIRISDTEIFENYKDDQYREIKGEKGSIILGDTLCWHKGKKILKGYRLIFQIQFSASLFGTNMPKVIINNSTDEFKRFSLLNKTYSQNLIVR